MPQTKYETKVHYGLYQGVHSSILINHNSLGVLQILSWNSVDGGVKIQIASILYPLNFPDAVCIIDKYNWGCRFCHV